jgi:transcription antitermination factor NusG
MFGDDVVFSNARANMVISAQRIIRNGIDKGKTDAEIQEVLTAWKPGTVADRMSDPLKSFESTYEKLSPEQQEAQLARLEALLAKKRSAA